MMEVILIGTEHEPSDNGHKPAEGRLPGEAGFKMGNIMGGWGLADTNGNLTTDPIENIIFMIPCTSLPLWALKDKVLKKTPMTHMAWTGLKFGFLFSVTIETLQLFLRLGTVQLSDIFYNTLGGTIGGLIYYLCTKLQRKKDEPSVDEKKG